MKIRYILKQDKREASSSETVYIFPVSRWIFYLVSVSAFIAIAFLSTIFFSLFLFGGIILGLWIWWRRKLHKADRSEGLEGEYVVIKESHIIEFDSDKERDQ